MAQKIYIETSSATRFNQPVDLVTGRALKMYVNNSIILNLSIVEDGQMADTSNISSATLEIKSGFEPAYDSTAVITKTDSSPNDSATLTGWKGRTAQHFTFTIDDDDLDISPGNYWISIYVTTTGSEYVVLLAGKLLIANSGTDSGL